jgi:hypothetical protein
VSVSNSGRGKCWHAGMLATSINEFILLDEEESACDEVEVGGDLRIC